MLKNERYISSVRINPLKHHDPSYNMRRRSAIEPVIGHLKAEHRMDRNYLAHRSGDAANTVLAAAGYNFRLLIRRLRLLLLRIIAALVAPAQLNPV